MNNKLKWGLLASGNIAKTFARGVAKSQTGEVVAVGSRTQEAADKFGEEFNVPNRHGSYEALLADPEVQAVYISPPHPMHVEWAIKAAEAGKHILCEKPIGMNHAEAMAIVEAAQRNDVFLMEAFMYRCHPQTAKIVELIREGAIGEVRVIQATFSFGAGFNAESRIYNPALGGGGILDVGCYCTSMSRLVAGVATGKDFADPVEVKAVAHLGSTGVDEYSVAVLKFPGEIVAQLSTGVAVGQDSVVRIFGTGGSIFVPAPWFCGGDEGRSTLTVQRGGEEPREVVIEAGNGLYAIEADTVAASIEQRQAPSPAMTWEDTLGNMNTLDMWRGAIGLTYKSETLESHTQPLSGRPIEVRSGHNMKYGRIEGIDKQASRLVLGTMLEGSTFALPHGFVLFDEFFASGGNTFDTAYVYGGGQGETIFGQWVKSRGVREQVVLLGKGAHTPHCNPEDLTSQLLTSLERLDTDYLDLYMLHRDNPEIPVSEFVDVLNEHREAGRMRAFGGSNWSLERVQEANEYARSKGITGFTAISNNFSLARMVDPVWAGSISTSDAESRAWLERHQMPLLAWSSQARGFFARAHPDYQSDPDLVRCWYSEDNFQRLERVRQIAEQRGVLPINVALAYVLCQPFPTFPLIGPRVLSEIRTSLPALDIELSPDVVRWLNLEGEQANL